MITKKRKVANTKVDANKAYSLKEASNTGKRNKHVQNLIVL